MKNRKTYREILIFTAGKYKGVVINEIKNERHEISTEYPNHIHGPVTVVKSTEVMA